MDTPTAGPRRGATTSAPLVETQRYDRGVALTRLDPEGWFVVYLQAPGGKRVEEFGNDYAAASERWESLVGSATRSG